MDWLKWYLSVPLKALAAVILWIGAVRARVRAQIDRIDRRTLVTWLTLSTAVLWLIIWLAADDADRRRLTDTVREMMTGTAD